MSLDKNINLIKDLLDITLNLQLFFLKDLPNNIDILKSNLSHIYTNDKFYFDNFLNNIFNCEFGKIQAIIDSELGNYAIICLDDKNKDYLLLGPYLYTKQFNAKNCDNNLEKFNAIKNHYDFIPCINKSKIENIVKILLKDIFNIEEKFEYIEKKSIHELKQNDNSNEFVKFIEIKSLEKISFTEQILTLSVKQGDKALASKCIDKLLINIDNLYENEKSLILKKKLIYYNVLLKKSVELEYVPINCLESLFSMYISKFENTNDFSKLNKLSNQMVLDYCNLTLDHKLKGYSPVVKKVIDYILLNIQNDLNVGEIAKLFFISPTYLSKLFKKDAGCSVIEYINKQRVKRATYLLKNTALPIHQISSMVGIDDLNYFSRLFKKYMDITPSQFRKNNTYIKKGLTN
jgi:YesN/AraC family two-component response regulator